MRYQIVLFVLLLAPPAAFGQDDAPQPRVVQSPTWKQRPTAQDIADVYPDRAMRGELEGRAVLRCILSTEGNLTNCEVAEETPPSAGFGRAALRLVDKFKVNPQTVDGRPVGGATMIVPIVFRLR